MEAAQPNHIILSSSTFKSLYSAVSDLVFLCRPSDGLILEGNAAFRAAAGIMHQSAFSAPLGSLMIYNSEHKLQPAELLQVMFKIDGREAPVPVRLQLQEVQLGQEMLLMGIASETRDAHDTKDLLAAAEKEKNALLKEVYHRVKNNLNVIVSLMSLQLNRVQDQQLRHLLTESKSRVFTMALLQERLYHSPRLSEVKANEYLISLAQAVIATFKSSDQQIALTPNTNECWLNVDVLVPLGLILHELVANAVQHAFKEQPAGKIYIQYGYAESGEYQLIVQDNGRGLPEASTFTSFKTLGAQMVVSLSRQLKGRLQVESSSATGTKVSLIFSDTNKHAKP